MKRFVNLNNNTKAIGIASTQKKEIYTIFQIKIPMFMLLIFMMKKNIEKISSSRFSCEPQEICAVPLI